MLEFLTKTQLAFTDTFILVQATNPFVRDSDFTQALNTMQEKKFDSMLSCCRIKRFFWNENGTPINYDYMNRPRRQDIQFEDATFVENGSFYIFSRQHFQNTGNRLGGKIGYHIIPEEYSYEIDSHADFAHLEKLAQELQKN